MKFRKLITGIMASAIMACSGISAVSANAASSTPQKTTKFGYGYMDMPVKGDANRDGKITKEDRAIIEKYINGTNMILDKLLGKDAIYDVNWDGVVDTKDLSILPDSPNYMAKYHYLPPYRSGDLNNDGVVNEKDLDCMKNHLSSQSILSLSVVRLGSINKYDLDLNGIADYRDSDALEKYITRKVVAIPAPVIPLI